MRIIIRKVSTSNAACAIDTACTIQMTWFACIISARATLKRSNNRQRQPRKIDRAPIVIINWSTANNMITSMASVQIATRTPSWECDRIGPQFSPKHINILLAWCRLVSLLKAPLQRQSHEILSIQGTSFKALLTWIQSPPNSFVTSKILVIFQALKLPSKSSSTSRQETLWK